jgi:hypothetical protein
LHVVYQEDLQVTRRVRVRRTFTAGTVICDRRDVSEERGEIRMTEGRGERDTGKPDVTINDPDDAIGGVAGGGSGERATGTSNTIYNLSSVLFHALEGGVSYDTYVEDAEREGDEDLTEFFRRVREEDRDRAAEARMLLAERTSTASRTGAATTGVSAGAEQIGSFPAAGDAPPGSAEAAASPRPEPSDDFPGTEPVEGEDPTARTGEPPPPPEEVPPERAGEIPMAEEVPAPRAEEVPSGTPSQVPPGDVQRESSAGAASRREEGPSLEPPTPEEEEMARRQAARDRGEEDEGLLDQIKDSVFGEEEQGRGGPDRPDRR